MNPENHAFNNIVLHLWIGLLLLATQFMLVSCGSDEMEAYAELMLEQNVVQVGDSLVLDASNSIFDSIQWYLKEGGCDELNPCEDSTVPDTARRKDTDDYQEMDFCHNAKQCEVTFNKKGTAKVKVMTKKTQTSSSGDLPLIGDLNSGNKTNEDSVEAVISVEESDRIESSENTTEVEAEVTDSNNSNDVVSTSNSKGENPIQSAGGPSTHNVNGGSQENTPSNGTALVKDVQVPCCKAQTLHFTDTDFHPAQIAGPVTIGTTIDESDLTHYVLYWGSGTTRKLAGYGAIVSLAKTGSALTYVFAEDTPLPPGATYLLVYTKNQAGESLLPQALAFSDVTDENTPVVVGVAPVDAAISVASNSSISVTFSEPMDISSVTGNIISEVCSGTVQISKDDFISCVKLSASMIATNQNQTFSFSPATPLNPGLYKIKITTGVRDVYGNHLGSDQIQTKGFSVRIASWSSISSNYSLGENKGAFSADYPHGVVFNQKLYVVFAEKKTLGGVPEIRVKMYDGSWQFVDGNGTSGLFSGWDPQLAVFNNKLYLCAQHSNGSILLMVFNGNDITPVWNYVSTRINKQVGQNGYYPRLQIYNNSLYAFWQESNGVAYQIRGSVFNGNDTTPSWTFVDGNGTSGLNKNINRVAAHPFPTVLHGKLYLAWHENDGNNLYQIRVKVYNGSNWSFADGGSVYGINKNNSWYAFPPKMAVWQDQLYGIWEESGSNGEKELTVKVLSGNDASPTWQAVDSSSGTMLGGEASITLANSQLFAMWRSGTGQVYAGLYHGNAPSPAWSFSPVANFLAYAGHNPQLIEFNNRIYAVWAECNYDCSIRNIRAAVAR
ncbi:MAG: Ig-like domain-containing protein [SAR324 cluster bacterium]|nr:Ig-like domain-containing protein [SAR324 cluster bacterium]